MPRSLRGASRVAIMDEATAFLVSLTLDSLDGIVWILLKGLHVVFFFFTSITPYHDKYLKMFFLSWKSNFFPKEIYSSNLHQVLTSWSKWGFQDSVSFPL